MRNRRNLALAVLLLSAVIFSISCASRPTFRLFVDESGYLSYDQTYEKLRALVEERPDLVKLQSLGKTWENRDIWAVSIGFDQDNADVRKPEILVTGGQHANEWIGMEVVRYFARRIVCECLPDSEMEGILKKANIWLIPIMNPDGYEYSRYTDRLWRKNRRPIGAELYGVDINRNFPYMWRLPDPAKQGQPLAVGADDEPSSRWFRGFSDGKNQFEPFDREPEVRALLALAGDPKRNFVMYLDYHSFSELVLYPPACSYDAPPDSKAYTELAEGMAEVINAERKNISEFKLLKMPRQIASLPFPSKYKPRQAGRLYSNVATGGSIDTMYYEYGMWSLAVELSPNEGNFIGRREVLYVSGQGFRLPSSLIEPTCMENWAGFLFAVRWALSHPAPIVLSSTAVQ